MHRPTLAAAAIGAAVALLCAATPAVAGTDATVPLGTFICSDGTTIEPAAKDVPGFTHASVGFIGGRAVAPRWFTISQSGTLVITGNSDYINDVVPFTIDEGESPNGRATVAPDLSRLTACTSPEDFNEFDLTLDAETVGFLRIDAKYIDAEAHAEFTAQYAVYLSPNQLAHR
jgi:hypothetical protein